MPTPTTHDTTDRTAGSNGMDAVPLRLTPFHVAGFLFLSVGLLFAVYRGLMWFELVPAVSWIGWSHVHYVTIGGFTQLLLGMMPQLAARLLDRPTPSSRYSWTSFLGLNGGLLVVWYGRAFGELVAYDVGLSIIWLAVLGQLLVLGRMALRSERRAWNPTVGLYLVSTGVFLVGIIYAIGLLSHPWDVPGGWLGLREAHVHANAWGFLGLAAIGTLFEVVPRLVDADLYSQRLKRYSSWLLVLGIVPLITGPWLGMGQSITGPGLVLYGAGFVVYAIDLFLTYRQGTKRQLARWLLAAQVWILGPAVFAPFIIYGFDLPLDAAWVEQGALHFFFMGWVLPVALAGLLVYLRALPRKSTDGPTGGRPPALLPSGLAFTGPSNWVIVVWNVAVLAVGIGFFFQEQSYATVLHGVGWTVLVVLWALLLSRAALGRRRAGNPIVESSK